MIVWGLAAAQVLLGVVTGNWFAGVGPALVILGVAFGFDRWRRDATRR